MDRKNFLTAKPQLKKSVFVLGFLFLGVSGRVAAQQGVNYDEAKAGTYTLPPVLTMANGKKVASRKQWSKTRRQEVLALFKEHVYGQMPAGPKGLHAVVRKVDSSAIGGAAISQQVRIYFTQGTGGPFLDMILFTPRKAKGRVPVFVGLNFRGNQTVSADESTEISSNYRELQKIKNEKPDLARRGVLAGRWEVSQIIQQGYGLATAYYGDLEQDHPNGWKTGIRTTLQQELGMAPSEWSAIGAWAWGLSRMLDYLQTDPLVDASRAIVMGHSRLGKAALWAGANDTRFAAVISNNSGEGGAALTRRWFGETTAIITSAFPHWFIPRYKTYAGNAHALPVDQHMLLALVAPRPLYVASATNDEWADPRGEFLAARHAEPVYALFGKKGLGVTVMPPPEKPVGHTIRYHLRTGKHDVVLYDWLQYIQFANSEVR